MCRIELDTAGNIRFTEMPCQSTIDHIGSDGSSSEMNEIQYIFKLRSAKYSHSELNRNSMQKQLRKSSINHIQSDLQIIQCVKIENHFAQFNFERTKRKLQVKSKINQNVNNDISTEKTRSIKERLKQTKKQATGNKNSRSDSNSSNSQTQECDIQYKDNSNLFFYWTSDMSQSIQLLSNWVC